MFNVTKNDRINTVSLGPPLIVSVEAVASLIDIVTFMRDPNVSVEEDVRKIKTDGRNELMPEMVELNVKTLPPVDA